MAQGIISGPNVVYKEFYVASKSIITHHSDTCYYGELVDAYLEGYTPFSAVLRGWTGVQYPITLFFYSDGHRIGAFSTNQANVSGLNIRVAYIKS